MTFLVWCFTSGCNKSGIRLIVALICGATLDFLGIRVSTHTRLWPDGVDWTVCLYQQASHVRDPGGSRCLLKSSLLSLFNNKLWNTVKRRLSKVQESVCLLSLSIHRPALFICHLKFVCFSCDHFFHPHPPLWRSTSLSAAVKKLRHAFAMCVSALGRLGLF